MAVAVATALACHGSDLAMPTTSASPAAASTGNDAREQSEEGSRTGRGQGEAHRATPVVCARRAPVTGSGVFGPRGGVLVIGASRLIIPGGALHDTVTITATSAGDTTSTVSFQPEGLHFAKPAGLVLSSAGCSIPDEGAPSIVYLAPNGTVLETIPAHYDPHWKAVAAPIVHFSGYAIAF
jgi:hypothetical protein